MEYPLTDMQVSFYPHGLPQEEILWNLGMSVTFSGAYSAVRLNEALNKLTEVYDQIRLQFAQRDGEPYGYILPFQYTQYPFFQFRSPEELSDTLKNFVNSPMDVHGPLFRYAVFDLCGRSGVIICAHHILLDGYSVQVMVSFLEKWLEGEADPDLLRQTYEEYMEAMLSYPQSKRFQRDCAYWKAAFAGKPDRTVLSGGTELPDYTSSVWETTVSPELFRKIRSYCREEGVSVSSVFSTALGAYIHREKGSRNFTIGIPVLNRTTKQELNTIGLYMHILPLMMGLSEGSFRENVQVSEFSKMDLFRHQKMTQTQINSLLWEEYGDTEALFDLVFDYQEFTGSSAERMQFCYSDALSTPMEIHVHSMNEELHRVIFRYRTGLFTRKQVSALWERVMNIIAHAMDHPADSLLRIPQYAMNSWESNMPAVGFNDTAFCYSVPDDATVCSLFEETAEKNPEKICITAGDAAVTYGQFLEIVGELDGSIRNKLHNRKSVVAILAERSVEMYAAIYAAVRGGNAYLPISPDDPPERIAYILQDSGAALVLAQRKFTSLAVGVPCMDLTEFLEVPVCAHQTSAIQAQPEDTAYVIYTSGSTGKPKGVRISHKSLLNRILWMQETYPLDEKGVILQKTPYTFDVSLWEIFWWSICGAMMAASLPGEHFLPAKILESVNRYQVSNIHFVPSVLDAFLTYLENIGFAYSPQCPVRHVFSSGEALKADLVRRFYRLFPYTAVGLHNLYGPTECTVDVTFYDCHPEDEEPVPIGRPIYNTQAYVLDSAMEPVPLGEMGQLCIAGQNVGQGYLNRPELTAEKFVPNPFGSGTLYLTGDYAMINKAGQILYGGRMDQQIKLNGQRIEICEIESVLRSTEGVLDAAVVICQRNSSTVLAGIYSGESAKEAAIRQRCKALLPPYMIPSFFIAVTQMPINANGKLDKKALTAMAEDYAPDQAYAPPVTEQERHIAELFGQILRVKQVGRNDNFFSLGGSSLAMIRALSEPLLQGVRASDFIENPTPQLLARHMEKQESDTEKRLQRLKKGTPGGGALILIPYAGGRAEAFAKLAEAVEQEWPECSLYCMEYPRDMDDCTAAAAEMELLSQKEKLFLYSHCAGSAAALQILNILEDRSKNVVAHFVAAASIPPAVPVTENMWQSVPDDMLQSVLEKAGASFDTLSGQQIKDMLSRFRRNTDFWTAYFSETPRKVSCPVSLILARKDLFTENDAEAITIWEQYAQTITSMAYLDTESHYFQSEKAGDLVKLIMRNTCCEK